jgi:hypothetical protein
MLQLDPEIRIMIHLKKACLKFSLRCTTLTFSSRALVPTLLAFKCFRRAPSHLRQFPLHLLYCLPQTSPSTESGTLRRLPSESLLQVVLHRDKEILKAHPRALQLNDSLPGSPLTGNWPSPTQVLFKFKFESISGQASLRHYVHLVPLHAATWPIGNAEVIRRLVGINHWPGFGPQHNVVRPLRLWIGRPSDWPEILTGYHDC